MDKREWKDTVKAMLADTEQYLTCMSLYVNTEGDAVELYLNTQIPTYSEWIEGEGGDIGLMRCHETNRVVGVRLPLLCHRLCVHHDGPIRINAGFKKTDDL